MSAITPPHEMPKPALEGLSETEAVRRYDAGQGNKLQAKAGRSYAAIVWQATFVPINLVLFVVSGALVVLGLPIDAGLTALPILGNIVVSAAMEASAKWRLDRLRILSTPRATVVRDGIEQSIDAARLVRGDILPVGIDQAALAPLVEAVATQMPPGDRIGDALREWLSPLREPEQLGASSASSDAGLSAAILDAVPFSSARRWSGVVEAATHESLVLGAPEVVLLPAAEPAVREKVEDWTSSGLRVVVLAHGSAPLRNEAGQAALPAALSAVAVFGFAEEIRPDATATFQAFEAAGVTIKVVSGDNPRTVAHIAQEAGLMGAEAAAANGPDLAAMDDAALRESVERSIVVGRVEPTLKARIVQALRAGGRYVGMIGDGVNDILGLKSAQLGIAMESGSGASRAVADIVLLDDRFAVLPKAVAEGRKIIDGMLSSSSLLLARTFYMMLIVLAAAIGGLAFPFTPRNNSLLALVTVGLPSMVVIAWARPVQSPPDFVRTTLRFSVPAAIAVTVVALPVYAYYLAHTGSVAIAQSALITITTFCGTLLIPILAPSNRSGAAGRARLRDLDWRPTVLAVAMAVLFGALMAPPLARWFYEVEPSPVADVARLGVMAIAWALVVFLARRSGFVDRLDSRVAVMTARHGAEAPRKAARTSI